jgi:DNA replication protein DnaC
MAQTFEQQMAQPALQELSFEDRFGLLLEAEILHRDNRRTAHLLKTAKLRIGACVEDIDYRHPRGIERSAMSALTSCQWILRQQMRIPTKMTADSGENDRSVHESAAGS